MQIRASGE